MEIMPSPLEGQKIDKNKLRDFLIEYSTNPDFAFVDFQSDSNEMLATKFSNPEIELLQSNDRDSILVGISDEKMPSAATVIIVVAIVVNKDCVS